MKSFKFVKKIILIAALFAFSGMICAQETEAASQVLLPIDVYIGDHAEIRYTFRSPVDFFPGNQEADHKELENPFTGLEDNFSVVSAELFRTGMEYTVRFVIIPWKIGTISFPSFDLYKALGIKAQHVEGIDDTLENPEFIVAFYPVQIKSIVEKTDNHQMMPPVPPIIIPGTTYVIFIIVFMSVVLLILFFRFLLKFSAIRKKWLLYLRRRAFRRNAEEACRKIKRLNKGPRVTDIEFCSTLQSITRNYLEFRFDYRFTAISSSAIRSVFEKICAGDIPAEIAFSVDELAAMFIRTDYIRYAHDSIDSQLFPPQEHQAVLAKTERKTLSEMVLKAIACFENPESQNPEDGSFVSDNENEEVQ